MTGTDTTAIIVDQFVAAPPQKVWRTLTEPALLAKWWAPGDISATPGHRFHLEMPGWGSVPCEILTAEPPTLLVYTFTEKWTLTWRLEAEGTGTRVFLEHSGFDLGDKRMADAFTRMGPGWRDQVLPQLADVAARAA